MDFNLFGHTGGLTGSPLLLKVAPLPMLTQSDAQTEDGHAMMKADTFHSFQHASVGASVTSAEDMSEVHTWIPQQLSTKRR